MNADDIVELLRGGVARVTAGERVDEHDHALQRASDNALQRHFRISHTKLRARDMPRCTSASVSWLIQRHVPAERYLVATNVHYAATLSKASVARSRARKAR